MPEPIRPENPETAAMPGSTSPSSLETTAVLIGRARQGEQAARDQLARRYLPYMRVFARGRLPRGARSLEETDDLVQTAMVRGFSRLDSFEARRGGSFLVYLRIIMDNLIRDRYRSASRRPQALELPEDLTDGARSPLDELVAGEERERYEAALKLLKPRPREAIILRFELDCRYEDIAEELGIASANAARMVVERALVRLAQVMGQRGVQP